MDTKIFITVNADFNPDGTITPIALKWDDGRIFDIDRILDVRPAASLKAGGRGLRYTCKILGKERYLYFENPNWFVEGK